MRRRISFTELFISLCVLQGVIVGAGFWAWLAFLEHYR
jgi:hypothetical protein